MLFTQKWKKKKVMEKTENTLNTTFSKLILEAAKNKMLGLENDARIKHGVPEDVICLGYLHTFHRELMTSTQMKEFLLSTGIHLCMVEDEGAGNGMYFYLFMDKKVGNFEQRLM